MLTHSLTVYSLPLTPTHSHSLPLTPTRSHSLPPTPTHSHSLPRTPTHSRSGTTRSGASRSGATRSGATRSGATRSGGSSSSPKIYCSPRPPLSPPPPLSSPPPLPLPPSYRRCHRHRLCHHHHHCHCHRRTAVALFADAVVRSCSGSICVSSRAVAGVTHTETTCVPPRRCSTTVRGGWAACSRRRASRVEGSLNSSTTHSLIRAQAAEAYPCISSRRFTDVAK